MCVVNIKNNKGDSRNNWLKSLPEISNLVEIGRLHKPQYTTGT